MFSRASVCQSKEYKLVDFFPASSAKLTLDTV